ncbi:hypothetical protein F5Y15DRAFT_404452 [Xylariaceae sp. FL0016]|nr:hypothetical protein F5Y15DRAFT_404452 [Xylariaceae sp. FL0016]
MARRPDKRALVGTWLTAVVATFGHETRIAIQLIRDFILVQGTEKKDLEIRGRGGCLALPCSRDRLSGHGPIDDGNAKSPRCGSQDLGDMVQTFLS